MTFADGHEELYEILVDPFEALDLVPSRAELLAGFRSAVFSWEAELARVPRRLEIAGRLVDEGGRPIPGAALRLQSASGILAVRTGRDGGFRFQNLPLGAYRIAAGPGVAQLGAAPAVSLPVGRVGAYLDRVVGVPEQPAIRPGTSSISGRLVDRRGRPLPDALVRARDAGRRPDAEFVVRTAADGRFLFENLPRGVYFVHAEGASGFRSARAWVAVPSDAQRTRDLVAWEGPRARPHRAARPESSRDRRDAP
jgi:hypothetical protein